MADGQENNTPDPAADFVVHESDGKETAAAEGSVGTPAEADQEPKGVDNDTDTAGEPDGDGEDAGEADDASDGGTDAEEGDSDEDDGEGDDDASDDDGDDGDEGTKNKVPARKRIGQLTQARRAAERETEIEREKNTALEARLAALEKKLTPDDDGGKDSDTGESKAAEDDGKPDPDKFTYGELDAAYQEELMEWKLDQRDAKREAKQKETRQTEAAEQQAQKVQKSYDDKIVAGVEAYDDFEKVVVDGAGNEAKGVIPKYDLSPDFALMALDSPVGHHVVYEVASDPEYSRKLAKMTPLQQAQEFGRLAAQYTSKDAKPPKKKNKATNASPPPTSKVNGSGIHKKAAKDMDFAEFEKFANKEVLGIGK